MKELYQALHNFQQEVPVILKETQGYNYSYADLPAIDTVVKPLLGKYGLSVFQPLSEIKGKPAIKTLIVHIESGESIEEKTPLPETSELKMVVVIKKDKTGAEIKTEKWVIPGFEQMSEPQAMGSVITYYRRYALASFLGLITDKDTDGTGAKSDLPF